jgi:hypothetical protein
MVQDLLPLLPQEPGRAALGVAIAGTILGAALWLTGARFSRALITLGCVAAGGVIGRKLPEWTTWTVSTMASSVGGAIVLGLAGYLLHRLWVGILLGAVLAGWAALGTWIVCHDPLIPWSWPAVDATTTIQSFAITCWQTLPDNIHRYLPLAAGVAFVSGLASTLLWPKVGQVLLYSVTGTSLLIGMGLAAIEYGRPEWMSIVPARTLSQGVVLAATVLFGAVVQWQLAFPRPSPGGARGGDDAEG